MTRLTCVTVAALLLVCDGCWFPARLLAHDSATMTRDDATCAQPQVCDAIAGELCVMVMVIKSAYTAPLPRYV